MKKLIFQTNFATFNCQKANNFLEFHGRVKFFLSEGFLFFFVLYYFFLYPARLCFSPSERVLYLRDLLRVFFQVFLCLFGNDLLMNFQTFLYTEKYKKHDKKVVSVFLYYYCNHFWMVCKLKGQRVLESQKLENNLKKLLLLLYCFKTLCLYSYMTLYIYCITLHIYLNVHMIYI